MSRGHIAGGEPRAHAGRWHGLIGGGEPRAHAGRWRGHMPVREAAGTSRAGAAGDGTD
ncbi:MAG TPA: hypothetical protein VGH38_00640 [Bryobacteraceae bacterium]